MIKSTLYNTFASFFLFIIVGFQIIFFYISDNSQIKKKKATTPMFSTTFLSSILVLFSNIDLYAARPKHEFMINNHLKTCWNRVLPIPTITNRIWCFQAMHKITILSPFPYSNITKNKWTQYIGWVNFINESIVVIDFTIMFSAVQAYIAQYVWPAHINHTSQFLFVSIWLCQTATESNGRNEKMR